VKKLIKRTSVILTVLLLIFISVTIAGIALVHIYQDEIRDYAITEINKQIEVKISVKSADLSFFKKFPFISLVLNDVSASSGKDFNRSQFNNLPVDTLFSASGIYLQFNLIDIIKKDYNLKRLHAVNGRVNVFVDSRGKNNYRIFKQTSLFKTIYNFKD